MPFPSRGTSGFGGSLDAAEVDARIASWARVNAPSGTVPPARLGNLPAGNLIGDVDAARLPGLRRRFATYDAVDRSTQDLEAGDFDPPSNIQTFVLRGGAAPSSVLDQWDGVNHPWNIAESYIDFNHVNDNEILTLSIYFFDRINAGYVFRISVRDDQNQVLSNIALVSAISNIQQTDSPPVAGRHLLFVGHFAKPNNANATRGVLEFIITGDRDSSSFSGLTIIGNSAYG